MNRTHQNNRTRQMNSAAADRADVRTAPAQGPASARGAAVGEFSTTITSAHYAAAPSMMQPYSGNWPVPAEGLLCYDVYGKTVRKVGEGLKVEIEGVGDRLYQISPIQNGWAIVGRTDKYLPAAGVEVLANDAKQLKLRLHEAGPFAIWLEKGRPKAAGIQFAEKGGGLFEAAIPIKPWPHEVTVEK